MDRTINLGLILPGSCSRRISNIAKITENDGVLRFAISPGLQASIRKQISNISRNTEHVGDFVFHSIAVAGEINSKAYKKLYERPHFYRPGAGYSDRVQLLLCARMYTHTHLIVEVRHSRSGYLVPGRHGLGVWPDGRVVGASPSATIPQMAQKLPKQQEICYFLKLDMSKRFQEQVPKIIQARKT